MRRVSWIAISLLAISGCGYANLDRVKAKAPETWRAQGFEPVGYQGFQWGARFGGTYGGACVWYSLHRIPDNGITYQGCLGSWDGEIHVYNVSAIDAINPKK